MNNKSKKAKQKEFAIANLEHYFKLLKTRFFPEYDSKYVTEIQKISQAFNIRLKREEKLLFCKKCKVYWDNTTREIRLNSQNRCKEYICKNCGHVRRFKYK